MKVLIATTAGAGHFSPLVPLARACGAAGHEVLVAAPQSFRDTVESAGLEHAAFADVPPEVMGQVFSRLPSLTYEQANEVVIADVFGRLDARAALPGMSGIFDAWKPDLVLRDPCEFASLAVACRNRVPQALVAIGVTAMTDAVALFVIDPLAELDALAGLPAGSCGAALEATETLTSVPATLDGETTGKLHRYRDGAASPPGSGLPDPWGEPDHPLVYVTFGSVAGSQERFDNLYRTVLHVLADEPVRVLLTTGHGLDPAELGPLPANAHAERWWAQSDVMSHADAVVGHGGFGTTMTAIAAGIPQVIMPLFSLDQRLNAERVEAVGAGLTLPRGAQDVGLIPQALSTLLTETSHREAAQTVAAEIALLPPVTQMMTMLERIAAGGVPR